MSRLIETFGEIFGILGTLVTFADTIDRNRRIAAEALAKFQPEESEVAKRWADIQKEKKGPARKEVAKFSTYNNRTSFQAAYNAFSTYITHLLKEVYINNSEILNSKNTIMYKEIIRFSRMKDLIDYMIEKRISDLSYQSIEDLNTELRDKLGFELFTTPRALRTISRIAEKRNLLTHNNGIVTHRYIEKARDERRGVGQKVFLQNAVNLMMYLLSLAVDIDSRARGKFGLTTRRISKGKANG